MRQWIRKYNYIQDYFQYVYEMYINTYPAYPVTYYKLDFENSIWETENVQAGTYEKLNIGDLSGVKFMKILMLPVHATEQIIPNQDSGEQGLTYRNSVVSRVSIPSVYGINPLEGGDFIDLNYGIYSPAIKNRPLFVVSDNNIAHHGEYLNLYQTTLKVAPCEIPDIEKQISTTWYFLESIKTVIPIQNAEILLNIEKTSETISNKVSEEFDRKTGFFMIN